MVVGSKPSPFECSQTKPKGTERCFRWVAWHVRQDLVPETLVVPAPLDLSVECDVLRPDDWRGRLVLQSTALRAQPAGEQRCCHRLLLSAADLSLGVGSHHVQAL